MFFEVLRQEEQQVGHDGGCQTVQARESAIRCMKKPFNCDKI